MDANEQKLGTELAVKRRFGGSGFVLQSHRQWPLGTLFHQIGNLVKLSLERTSVSEHSLHPLYFLLFFIFFNQFLGSLWFKLTYVFFYDLLLLKTKKCVLVGSKNVLESPLPETNNMPLSQLKKMKVGMIHISMYSFVINFWFLILHFYFWN